MSAEGWATVTIEALIEEGVIAAHKDGNHGSNYPRASEFDDEGVPFLTAKLLDDSGNIDLASAPRLSNEKADKFKFGFIETNDVLLSHNATVGRVAVVPELADRVLIGTSLTHYRLDESRLLPKYLAAYFSGVEFQNQLASVMSQTTRNQVPITSQRKLSVVVPPIEEQQRIAGMLGAFDDKIKLNRQINQTLEHIAQAIFKSWFVDFEPTRAKIAAKQIKQARHDSERSAALSEALLADGRWPKAVAAAIAEGDPERAAMAAISGAVQGCTNAAKGRMPKAAKPLDELDQLSPEQQEQLITTAALFPDELVDSELGEIPEGWVSDSLAAIMDIAGGTQPPAKEFIDEPKEGYIRLIQIRDYATENHPAFIPNTKKLRTTSRTDIMIARYGASVGRICWGMEGAYNVALVKVICDEYYREYLRTYLSSSIFQLRLAQMSGRSAQAGFNKSDIASFTLVVPTKKIACAYQNICWDLREKILQSKSEILALEGLRDSLLPKLLSGELKASPSQTELDETA